MQINILSALSLHNMRIPVDCFRHELDKAAYEKLESSAIFKLLWKLVSERLFKQEDLEVLFRMKGVRITEKSNVRIYGILRSVCDMLRIPVPYLYISSTLCDEANALAVRRAEKNYIILSDEVTERWTDDTICTELLMQCLALIYLPLQRRALNSAFFRFMSNMDQLMISVFNRFAGTVYYGVCRTSVLTIDRAALLMTGDKKGLYRYLLGLNGADTEMTEDELDENIENVLSSEKIFDEYYSSTLRIMKYNGMHLLKEDVPNSASRIHELEKWAKSEQYAKLRACVTDPDNTSEWSLPYSSKNIAGKSADEVKAEFEECSFHNIVFEQSFRRDPHIPEGGVVSVTVGGNKEFKAGEFFDRNTQIVITTQKRNI